MTWKRLLLFVSTILALLTAATPAWAEPPQLRLAWGSCTRDLTNGDVFLGGVSPTSHVTTMVITAANITTANTGTDITVSCKRGLPPYGPVPDCWRFEDTGCQTSSRIEFRAAAFSKALCPLLQGEAPLSLTRYGYDPGDGHVSIRLANTYNAFTPSPTALYTVWQVRFDHSFTDMVDPVEPDSCAGGQEVLVLEVLRGGGMAPHLLTPADSTIDFVEGVVGDWLLCVNWNPAPTLPTSWGRVKATYR